MSLRRNLAHGAIAGAVGTTALNVATFLDMVLRGRPASSTPETTVDRLADVVHVQIPGSDDQRDARRTATGSLLGTAAGVGAGVVLGALRQTGRPHGVGGTAAAAWVLAMLAGNGPMTVMQVTDPRQWGAQDWAADIVPHLAYAAAAAATLQVLDG
jgi:hypothetical protein